MDKFTVDEGNEEKVDIGDEVSLTNTERIIKTYDVNNDGELSVSELKEMARNLREERKGRTFYKRASIIALVCFIISFAGNFGLTWSVMKLTQQIATNDGNIVDSHTGEKAKIQARGDVETLTPNLTFARRLMETAHEHRRSLSEGSLSPELHEDLRMLTDLVPVARAENCDMECCYQHWKDASNGATQTLNIQIVDDTYTGTVPPGFTIVKRIVNEDCITYENLPRNGLDTSLVLRARCCRNNNFVDMFASNPASLVSDIIVRGRALNEYDINDVYVHLIEHFLK